MPEKIKLILNPMAAMGAAWRSASDLRPIASQHGNTDWCGTLYPNHAAELARQAGLEGYDRVVALGGDGTVHEVVNGLMQVPAAQRPALGVVPLGSGNDFAYVLGTPQAADRALQQALTGPISAVDVGLMTDENGRQEYFDNTVGIGFDAVVTIRSHKLPVLRGVLMYLTAVIQTILLNHHPNLLKVSGDGLSWEETVLMFTLCNGPREGGGFMIAPDAKIDDGLFNYTLVRKCGRLTMFRMVPEFMRGTHARFSEVSQGACRSFNLSADRPMYIHADGEVFSSFGSNLKKLSFEMLPGALKVVRG